MAFRTLTVDSAAEIHVRGGQLTVQRERDEKPLQIALDDIACIVVANLDITLSTGALDMISQRGITILGCGRNYKPTSIMLPFARNSRYSEIVDAQLSMSLPLEKRFWKVIVKKKIGQTRLPQSRASCSTRRTSPRTSSGWPRPSFPLRT